MINNLKFLSSDHIRYQNGVDVSGHNKGNYRGIEIVEHPTHANSFLVTIYNMSGIHPLWGDNVQMAPKVMEIIEENNNTIKLRGKGEDAFGNRFSDYGITINFLEDSIENIILHLFDRAIEIVYYE